MDRYLPKLPFFFEKYKLIIKENYKFYINNLKNINEDKESNINFISKHIYTFTLKLIENIPKLFRL